LVSLSREVHKDVDQWAKLVGAYAPIEHDVNVRQSATAVIDRAEAELLALAQRQPQSEIIDAEVVE
jgi:hypothetical protein